MMQAEVEEWNLDRDTMNELQISQPSQTTKEGMYVSLKFKWSGAAEPNLDGHATKIFIIKWANKGN